MGHFAHVNASNIVDNVIVAEQDFINSGAKGPASEWIQTSYNTRGNVHYTPDSDTPSGQPAVRGNYAGIGYTYDPTHDVFYSPRPSDANGPFSSWTISAATNWTWTAPTPMPSDAGTGTPPKVYIWNEATTAWVVVA